MIQKEKVIIIFTVLLDVIGLGIVIPILPFYVQNFGATPFETTLLFSVFALCSFISSPFLGALSDKIGRRPVLILSMISTAVGWFVFANANAIWILFIGRIIDGMAAGNFPIAQSYLVDLARNEKERTTNLGLIGAVFGIGFILGPGVGATLSSVSPSFPFWIVGSLATLNVIAAFFFLPETHHNLDSKKKLRFNPLIPLAQAVKDKILLPRYTAWFLFGLSFSAMQSVFSLYVHDRFGFSAQVAGYLFMGMGVVMVFNQTYGLQNIWLKYFKERTLEIWFFLLMAMGFLFADLGIFGFFLVGIFMITLAQSTLRVVMSSGVAGAAGSGRRGEVLGIMASIVSAAMIVGPMIAGVLFQLNIILPFLLDVLLLLAAFLIMIKFSPKEKLSETANVDVLG